MVGNLTARRDLTDVRDVVRAYRLLAERGVAGEVYNVCSGRDIAIADVARQLQSLAGVELRFELDPALARPVDVPVVRGDFAKLHEATGWEPRLSLERTLARRARTVERSRRVAAPGPSRSQPACPVSRGPGGQGPPRGDRATGAPHGARRPVTGRDVA